MGRILAIDYGKVRTGLAVTDPLQLSINGLPTVTTATVKPFLMNYIEREDVRKVIIGYPTHADDTPTHLCKDIDILVSWLKEQFKHIEIEKIDEAFTSHEASKQLREMGVPQKKRRQKGKVDEMSAMVILQQYLLESSSQ